MTLTIFLLVYFIGYALAYARMMAMAVHYEQLGVAIDKRDIAGAFLFALGSWISWMVSWQSPHIKGHHFRFTTTHSDTTGETQ